MHESKVIQNFTSLFFPFRYNAAAAEEDGFNRPVVKENGKEARLWHPLFLNSYHLKASVAAMLGKAGGEGRIGRIYRLEDGARRSLGIPEARTAASFFCRGRETSCTVHITEVRLILFCTGIGMLEFCFSTESADAGELLDVNYFLTEVKSEANFLRYEKRLGRNESETVSFRLLDLVKSLTASLGGSEDFDTAPGMHYVDNKPLIFGFLLFDRFPNTLGQLLFNLRTNFKASYHMPDEEYDLRTASGIYHPFQNVYWGTSLNGTVCCAALTGEEKTDLFFRETFAHNLRESYLQLYLLRQHQRYGLQDFQRRFVEADRELDRTDGQGIQQAYAHVRALQDQVVSFRLKCMYQDPTSVEHINNYDRFLVENLRIEQNLSWFGEAVRQLDALAAGIREKIEARAAEKKRLEGLRRERLIYIITALWSCVVFLESAWELAEHLLGRSVWFDSGWILLPAVFTVLPVWGIIIELRKKNRELREEEQEYTVDEKNGTEPTL